MTATLLWPVSKLPQPLGCGEVHVWAWVFPDEDEIGSGDLAHLDSEERDRAGRFHFACDRISYSVSHANMRRILGAYVSRSPQSLVFSAGMHGKPRIAGICFNLSHCKTVGVLALSYNLEVGVDVEDIRPIESGVAKSYFSARELADLANMGGAEWLEGFYRCWTRKEACSKPKG